MLIAIAGDLGSGKTFLATVIAGQVAATRTVFANYEIHLPNVVAFQLNDFLAGHYTHCLTILDEAYVYLEARISASNLNRAMSYILFQSRKRDCDIIITAQIADTVDLRFRELCQVYIRAQKRVNRFLYDVYVRKPDHSVKHFLFHIKMRVAEQYFELYDTNQIIQTESEIPVAHVFDETEIQAITTKFCAESGKRTKTAITGYLRLHKMPLSLADAMYYLVKN